MSAAQDPIAAAGAGTAPGAWRTWPGLQRLPRITPPALLGGGRLVLVAPHPDDEVLGCGGLLASLGALAGETLLVSVTDGEASHPGSPLWPRERLREVRPQESREALARLGLDLPRLHWRRLRMADGQVAAATLDAALRGLLRPGDRLVSTWRHDGHPDHEQVGQACAAAAAARGARHCEVPIWAWHWAEPGDPRLPWARARRLDLDERALWRKRRAIAAHASQLQADPSRGAGPILGPHLLETLSQPFEVYFL
ncbi:MULTISPECIES: PIG-L family deacetylase [Pseudomonas]|uniref:PIG-L deacetylase family protein n=1 Tax=Pseudomonas TaxID=286 RepID=UPI002E25F5EC|nr:PIG-L family deacetylase [Pseudomonas sp. JH-2]